MYHSIWSYDAVWSWICLNHLEFYRTHASTNQKYITFVYRPVRLQKVWLQIHLEEISVTTFHSQ